MLAPVLFLLGVIIGSFLNVLVLRRGVHTITGRSSCPSCNGRLAWYDMIPVLSWLMLRGRCRRCGSRISVQYPLVEVATGSLFAILALSPLVYEPAILVVSLAIACVLVAIAAYDILHTIIPDRWAYLFAALAFVYMVIRGVPDDLALYYYLAGPIAALPIASLWAVSRGRWIGLGDAKLCLGIGWLLGPVYGVFAVFFAFVIGAFVSVFILMPLPHLKEALRGRGIARFGRGSERLTMKSEVPFGPFLIASCLYVWFALLFNLLLP